MQIYFDTNIYRFVRARNEVSSMCKLLKAYGGIVTASGGNLFETFAISSVTERRAELDVLVQVAKQFERKPDSWFHAVELRDELRFRRPSWVRKVPLKRRQVREFLDGHAKLWASARGRELPPSDAYAQYSRDAEQGISVQRQYQKTLREFRLRDRTSVSLQNPSGQVCEVDVSDPEMFWRVDGLMVWYNAIEVKNPSCRDYADWLSPYLKPGSFRDPSYQSFWLEEVASDSMPLNKLTGLASFYQLEQSVSHGNSADQLHAGQWLRADLFVTADQAFYSVLKRIADLHFTSTPKPVLIDRSAPSCTEQLESILRGMTSRTVQTKEY